MKTRLFLSLIVFNLILLVGCKESKPNETTSPPKRVSNHVSNNKFKTVALINTTTILSPIKQIDIPKTYSAGEKNSKEVNSSKLLNNSKDVKASTIKKDVQVLNSLKDLKNEKNSTDLKDSKDSQDVKSVNINSKDVSLYFASILSEKLQVEKHSIDLTKNVAEATLIVEELIKGPKSPNYMNLIPRKTKVLNSFIQNRICFINLNKEFITDSNTGTAGEIFIVYSIVYSITELPGIDKVQFMIEGKPLDTYLHMDMSEPLGRDDSLFK